MLPPAGVVAASGGNHGAAVAVCRSAAGVPATIFVPTVSSPAKVERIRATGARLEIVGDRYDDALRASEEWRAKTGAMPIHAFDDPETLLGSGHARARARGAGAGGRHRARRGGRRRPDRRAWRHGTAESIRIVGVEPEAAPTLTYALAAGQPVDAPAGGIAADSLAPRRVGQLMYSLAAQYIDSGEARHRRRYRPQQADYSGTQ